LLDFFNVNTGIGIKGDGRVSLRGIVGVVAKSRKRRKAKVLPFVRQSPEKNPDPEVSPLVSRYLELADTALKPKATERAAEYEGHLRYKSS
jgi:hypothetical protein